MYTRFLEFYPQGKKYFFNFLLSQFLFFNFSGKRKIGKLGSLFTLTGPEVSNSARPTTSARRPVAPRQQRGPGPTKCRGRARPPGPQNGPLDLSRPRRSDGRPRASHDQNANRSGSLETLAAILLHPVSLFASLLSAT